ncbi:hypothetical protein JKP88DRAFT_241086 [Tribonema minus]|uniref:Protein kinase domain-containing protein n=1 Tax=Tribonema minus TaxID=303371 RepID=A0A836CHS8_9STRA|nr:hypothetical protein JKP88DRAFT_241086 [Tribonema minus]
MDVCDAITRQLPSKHRYRITDVRNRGSYGIVLAGRTDQNADVVVKLVNLSSVKGMNVLGEPWYMTKRASFDHEVGMLHAVNLGVPDVFPEVLDACVVKRAAGVNFGFVLMRDAGTESLHTVLASGRIVPGDLMPMCAHVLKGLHDKGFVHGDLHAGNVICESTCVTFVDTSRTLFFANDNADFRAAKLYDLAVLINSVDDIATQDHTLCAQFLREYNHTQIGADDMSELLFTPEQLQEKRQEYLRILSRMPLM